MKKLLTIAVIAASVAAFGDDPETVTIGTIGVTAINSSSANTIVAVSYKDLDGADGIKVANLVKTTNLTEGDTLMTFSGGSYQSWSLGSDKTWKGAAYTYATGKNATSGGDNPQTLCGVGTGFWLIRQNPSASIYIYGKPVDSTSVTTSKGVWNLVGNPTRSDYTFTHQSFSEASTGDQIAILKSSGKLLYYTFTSGKGWRRSTGPSWVNANETIPAGTGFWIKTKEALTLSFSAQ